MSKSSIRPVPSFAKIRTEVLQQVRSRLLVNAQDAQEELDRAFGEFEESQPIVCEKVGEVLNRPLGESALALGFFLSLAVWMAFDHAHGDALEEVTLDGFHSTSELVKLDEELRIGDKIDALETDDVISMEQPALVHFIHEHIEAALDMESGSIDAEELQLIYRVVLIEVLALSYAVKTPLGFPTEAVEILA